MSIAENVKNMMENASWIREMFEKGRRLKDIHGEDQVFDFSLGNPIIEPPERVYQVLKELLEAHLPGGHRYMPNAGLPETRAFIARTLSQEMGLPFESGDIAMCVGAGGGLNTVLKALLNPAEEVLTLAPYFVEYGVYAQNHGGVLRVAETNDIFQIDLEQVREILTPQTKIILVNSPNNPTGAVYPQEDLDQLGKLLAEKEQEYGHAIYLVSDDPYRHLLFDDLKPCNIFQSHPNAILVTSHSKDLGLPGERIGFIAIHPGCRERVGLQNALTLTTRILGFVNAPALMQRILPQLQGAKVSADVYQRLRDVFCDGLLKMGFDLTIPQGTFYIFPKSPIPDDVAFVNEALSENILLVPGSGFGRPGYFRIAYCCTEETILRSFPHFKRLAQKYGLY